MNNLPQTLEKSLGYQKPTDHSRHSIHQVTETEWVINFGPYCLDSLNVTLTCDHKPLTLTPKAFSLLCFLVDSQGQLLSKDEIFDQVWPGLVVTDAALTVCIREIRKVLGDSSKTPRFIETVHKRGFRFICEISPSPDSKNNSVESLLKPQASPNIVGRKKPLQIISQCLEKGLLGFRQLVFITGEPGIGKTTMVEAFLSENIQNTNYWVAKGQCIDHYGTGEAYLPLLDAIGGLARKHADELTEILTHYAPTWLEHLPALSSKNNQPYNIPINTQPQCMLREITEALEAIAEKRPLILILEDLHWSDHATIDLLSFLARRSNPVRLIILGTYRSTDAAINNHPVKKLKQDLQLRDRCTAIPLEFLNQQDMVHYLSVVFPNHDFPEQLPSVIHQQSNGNPLFMVNLLHYLQNMEFLKNIDGQWQMLKNISATDRFIPDDLELMINQQVEQLASQCQTLLEVASIASEPGGIATQFTLEEVASVLELDELDIEPCLESLARNGHFLHALGATEWSDGSFSYYYEFTHALYQNVLYNRVSAVRKIQLHKQFGLVLEEQYSDRGIENTNKLAVHFEIGRNYSKAIQYLTKVAELSARCGANREAIYNMEKAQQLLKKLPATKHRSRLELSLLLLLAPAISASQGNATPEIETCFLRAGKLCKELGEHSEQFRVQFGLRSFYIIRGNLAKAYQLAQSLLELATQLNNSDYLLEAQVGLASSEFFYGNHQASYQHALQGIALYDQQSHAGHAALYGLDPGVFCYARAGQTIWPQGYPDQALEYEQQAIKLAENLDHPYSLVFAIHNQTQVLLYRQDGETALISAKRGKAMALKHGFSFLSAWAFHLTAWAYAMTGASDNARSEIKQALTLERPKAPSADFYLTTFLAETYHLLGDFKNGLSSLEVPGKEHSYEAEHLYLQAEFMLLSDNSNKVNERAEILFNKALQTSRQQQLKSYELRTAISLSKLLIRQKRNLEAQECLDEIVPWFQEGFNTIELQQAKQLLKQIDALREKEQKKPNTVNLDLTAAITSET